MERGQNVWLRAVITAYEAKLLRYAGDIVGHTLAADVVQDTFLKLCREPRECESGGVGAGRRAV